MLLRRSLVAVIILAAGIALSSRAADDKPAATDAPKEKPKTTRLSKPWSEMPTLTSEQKDQIRDRRVKLLADIKALRQKEYDENVAMLNDDQKLELKKIETAAKAGRKSTAAPAEGKKD